MQPALDDSTMEKIPDQPREILIGLYAAYMVSYDQIAAISTMFDGDTAHYADLLAMAESIHKDLAAWVIANNGRHNRVPLYRMNQPCDTLTAKRARISRTPPYYDSYNHTSEFYGINEDIFDDIGHSAAQPVQADNEAVIRLAQQYRSSVA